MKQNNIYIVRVISLFILFSGVSCTDKDEIPSSSTAFKVYMERMAETAKADSDIEQADAILSLRAGGKVPGRHKELAAKLLRGYVVATYGDSMVADLQEMVGFRTYAEEGRENWMAPEFLLQREWLENRCKSLGLDFKSYNGRVEEISYGKGERVLGLLTHGDVQGVEGQNWSSPPWEGRLVGSKIVGRGTEDDKGPIIASMYVLKALKDAGWNLGYKLRVMVSNGEESSWNEIPYYLKRAGAPDVTIGLDAAYPVTSAQKAFGIITITTSETEAEAKGSVWRVVGVSGGSGLSIIPERGEAILEPLKDSFSQIGSLRGELASWLADHPAAHISVNPEAGNIKLTAMGRGGHSSKPSSGHNALGDLTAFLATLDLKMDSWGALVKFVGIYNGTETDGTSFGIAHTDPFMGDLTVSLAFLYFEERPTARINIRVPRGISTETITDEISLRAGAFNDEFGVGIEPRIQVFGNPHIVSTDTKLVSTLLKVWEDVIGERGEPIAVGGGTQAKLFPGGVDFGPSFDFDDYRGHGTDEYLTVEELMTIAELTVSAVWLLAAE